MNILRGLPENAPINISMDVRYNSTTVKNSYGAGQAALQVIGAAIEWQTDQHQIVAFHLENKLCKVRSMLCSQGHNVTCPGHERCSATLQLWIQSRSMTLANRQATVSHKTTSPSDMWLLMEMHQLLVGYRMLCQQSSQKDRLTQHTLVRHNLDIS